MDHVLSANVEVPSGIPTGLPPAISDAASRVAADGLVGSLLILSLALNLLLGWVIWKRQKWHEDAERELIKAHEAERDEWEARQRTISDQRIDEIRQVMTALNNNTGALNVITQTQADRTASMERLTAKLGEVVQHVGNLERSSADHTKAIDRNLGVIDRIAWAVNAKGSAGPSGAP